MLSLRDPIHGFVRADPLEAALLETRPMQRLRSIRQLGFAHLVFPGAEHSRFSHALGAMELAGRVFDALADKSDGLLERGPRSRERRLVRVAALLHDIGHAPFSHSAENLFEEKIDHEEMTRRLILMPELQQIFQQHGDPNLAADVVHLLAGRGDAKTLLLAQIISGELDVDKMDYLLRDSLYCGVRYGSYDLDRLLDTIVPLQDPESGRWGIGVESGGVHTLEALVLARYYMFTQVYFNVTSKVLELHLNEWLRESGHRWPADPQEFLRLDDFSILWKMQGSSNVHADAILRRRHYQLAHETREHLAAQEKSSFEALLHRLGHRFGADRLLVSNSAKDPHRLGKSRVLVRYHDGRLDSMEEASHFIRHLTRIDQYRIYAPEQLCEEVAAYIQEELKDPGSDTEG